MSAPEYADLLEKESTDSGYCPACGRHIDRDCDCTDEEREAGPQGCTCPIGSEFCTC